MAQEIYANYNQYKTWEEFLGDDATEKTYKDKKWGIYYKVLKFKVGTMTVEIIGPGQALEK